MRRKSITSIAFFLPLIVAAAYLNMGQGGCGDNDPPQLFNFTVSKTANEVAGNASSYQGSASADGQRVAFSSLATNLDAGADNGWQDIFVHDVSTDTTTWVSDHEWLHGADALSHTAYPILSADGRLIAFYAETGPQQSYPKSVGILPIPPQGSPPGRSAVIFTGDLDDIALVGELAFFYVALGGCGVAESCINLFDGYSMSSDGRYFVYSWLGVPKILDRPTGLPELLWRPAGWDAVSPRVTPDGVWTTYGLNSSFDQPHVAVYSPTRRENIMFRGSTPSISDDGNFVAYEKWGNIYLFDRVANTHEQVSIDSAGHPSDLSCAFPPLISGNGGHVAFRCTEPMTSHGAIDQVYVRDLVGGFNGITRLASVNGSSLPYNAPASLNAIAPDGSWVVVSSEASNAGAVPGGTSQVFRVPRSHWD